MCISHYRFFILISDNYWNMKLKNIKEPYFYHK